jgi:lysyl-tRNA synthetase, class II
MRFAAVESTTLVMVSYDDTRELLQLEFCSRAVYQYFQVPATVHQSLLDAPSKGRYFNQVIRGRFPYRLISQGGAAPGGAAVDARCDR